MGSPSDGMKSALFRAAPGGWVFRSPNPWVFGDTPHYLVNDAQKAQIEAIVAPTSTGCRRGCADCRGAHGLGGCGGDFHVGVVRSREPDTGRHRCDGRSHRPCRLIALLPIAAVIQRRRLGPVLAGAALKLSGFRMRSAAERASGYASQAIAQGFVATLFACFVASFALLIHLVTRHFVFDGYVALWGFVAISFGFASFTWYRQLLGKAAILEGVRGPQKGPMKWIGLSGVVLICALALLYLAVGPSEAWSALAVGRAPFAGTVTVSVVGKATEDLARKRALEACRTAKTGSAARLACAVVATFHRECFAFAGAEWAIAVDEQSARKAATAKCSGDRRRVISGCGIRIVWK